MVVIDELLRILKEAQAQVRTLERPDIDQIDAVLIVVASSHLQGAVNVLRAATSREGANHNAPEEPASSTH